MAAVVRHHDTGVVAIHKETNKMFGGKAAGTQVGYTRIGNLKQAIRNADLDPEDYRYSEFHVDDSGQLSTDIVLNRGNDS